MIDDQRGPLRILVVCTANVCRSPVAERLLARHLAQAGIAVVVTSAGTHGGRLNPHEHTVRAAAEFDVDLRDHRSRQLAADLLADDGADLVITMTREHLRAVVGIDPSAWPRTFTLKELERRLFDAPLDTAGFEAWRVSLGADRRAAEMISASSDDDLADPYGGPYAEHVAMVREVDGRTHRLAGQMPARS